MWLSCLIRAYSWTKICSRWTSLCDVMNSLREWIPPISSLDRPPPKQQEREEKHSLSDTLVFNSCCHDSSVIQIANLRLKWPRLIVFLLYKCDRVSVKTWRFIKYRNWPLELLETDLDNKMLIKRISNMQRRYLDSTVLHNFAFLTSFKSLSEKNNDS